MNATDPVLTEYDGLAVSHLRTSTTTIQRTYREIGSNIRHLSHGLAQLGVRRGERVLIVANTSIETLEMLVAVMRAGAVAVPLNPLVGTAHLLAVIRSMSPTCCIIDDPLPEDAQAELLSRCRCFVSLRRSPLPGQHSYGSLLRGTSDADGRAELSEDDEALIVFSSGSEGAPKGIWLSHAQFRLFLKLNAFMHAQYSAEHEQECSRSPFISVIPLNHLSGIGMCLNGLESGRTTHLMTHFRPEQYLRLIEASRTEMLWLVSSMYRALLADPHLASTDLSSVRYCIAMGEPCSPELLVEVERAFDAIVATACGMTECVTGLGHRKSNLLRADLPLGSCGTHLFGEVKLVDESGAENDRFGELWVRNETVRPCYVDEALNVGRFKDGWFATKDLYERGPTGHFFHRGRSDDMFVCNGKNLYPAEIERVLERHPAIAQVCASPIQTSGRKTMPGVLVVAMRAMQATEVIEFAALHGPGHAIPQVVSFTPQLPLVGPGKIDRVKAKQVLQKAYDRSAHI